MSKFANMKFAVKDAAQSEALQKVLFDMGYKWVDGNAKVAYTAKQYLYTYAEGDNPYITNGEEDGYFNKHDNKEMDTGGFIALMTSPYGKSVKAAPTCLEDAYDHLNTGGLEAALSEKGSCISVTPAQHSGPWMENVGTAPNIADKSILIDVQFTDDSVDSGEVSEFREDVDWKQGQLCGSIKRWRYHNYLDYYKQPTSPRKVKSDGLRTSYYGITVRNKSGSLECQVGDVIAAMVGNDFDLGNAIKAIRRIYEASQGRGKEGIDMEYDKNKINYFINEFIERSKL